MSTPKILLIGLDACDVDLMLRWSAEGRMPFLKSLMERSAFRRLVSTKGMFSDSPWPSLNGGVSPAKHAFYNYLQLKRGSTQIERIDARHCKSLPFWARLRGTGLKVAALDVPKTFPIEGLDGVQLSGWSEHYPLLQKPASLPREYVGEVISRFGKYPHPDEIINPRSRSQERGVYRVISDNMEHKFEQSDELMRKQDWDLFISVISEVHYAGHQFYHHYEKSHWAHEPDAPADLCEVLPNLYTQLDTSLARIFKNISDDTTFFLVSVHGFATNYSANHMMSKVLEKLGFSTPPPSTTQADGQSAWMKWTSGLRSLIPRSAREYINKHFVPQHVHDQAYVNEFANHVDWNKTKVFYLPSDHFQAFLSVNLKGREPMGTVTPGSEFDAVCDDLERELRHLINPATGKPAVANIRRTRDVFPGPNLLELPDIVVDWTTGTPIKQLSHPRFGTISDPDYPLRKTQHTAEGFLIAGGKHINTHAEVRETATIDLAPTILHLLGQPIPSDFDGRILTEVLDEVVAR